MSKPALVHLKLISNHLECFQHVLLCVRNVPLCEDQSYFYISTPITAIVHLTTGRSSNDDARETALGSRNLGMGIWESLTEKPKLQVGTFHIHPHIGRGSLYQRSYERRKVRGFWCMRALITHNQP